MHGNRAPLRAAVAAVLLISAPGRDARSQPVARSVGARPVVVVADTGESLPIVPRAPRALLPTADSRLRPAPWWAPVASLAVPGAGQAALRQTRGVAYVAAEAYAWVQALEFRREANRSRAEYRRSATNVARAPFGATRDTSWAYYEAMEDHIESGRYNANPTPGGPLIPETDTSTYNGVTWYQLRALYWDPETQIPTTDPRYQRALRDYQVRAVKDDFRWSWRNRQIEWDVYKNDIARENQLSRDVTMTLVVIGANHLVSAIDALASVRVREFRGPQGEQRIEATMPWPKFGRRSRERR